MLEGAALLDRLDAIYEHRICGDKAAMAEIWAPGATYQLIGGPSAMPGAAPGAVTAQAAVDSLMDVFRFHSIERIDAVTAGGKAAVHWRLSVSSGGGAPQTTELFDFVTFDADGKIMALVQATDTALIARMLA